MPKLDADNGVAGDIEKDIAHQTLTVKFRTEKLELQLRQDIARTHADLMLQLHAHATQRNVLYLPRTIILLRCREFRKPHRRCRHPKPPGFAALAVTESGGQIEVIPRRAIEPGALQQLRGEIDATIAGQSQRYRQPLAAHAVEPCRKHFVDHNPFPIQVDLDDGALKNPRRTFDSHIDDGVRVLCTDQVDLD